MTDTSETEVQINGVQYWTDDQLQDILDQHRDEVIDEALLPVGYMEAGSKVYKKYFIPHTVGKYVETVDSGADVFSIVDTLGVAAPTYTVDFNAQLVTFAATTDGHSYFLRCRRYDVRASAAQVWLDKAAHRYQLIKWKAGAHTLDEDIEYQHCLQMHQKYGAFSGVGVTRLRRIDYGSS
jgi:hypothetical protein